MIRRLIFLLLCLPASVFAQALEIIALQHRTAEDIVPQVRQFVEPGGTVSGMGDRLFVRASRRNQEELRRLIAELDRPLRRLMISVRQEGDDDVAARGAGVSGSVTVINGRVGAGGTARVYSSSRSGTDRLMQQVQTIDGGRAMIAIGQSFWIPFRQVMVGAGGVVVASGLVQRDIGSGFDAVPRLSGERVSVEISPQHEVLEGNPATGAVRSERLVTTVAGPLGEWLVLGGSIDDERVGDGGGQAGQWSSRSASRQRRLLMKVEALP